VEVLGPYTLHEVIARGATSTVWRARWADGSGPDVAIKRGPGLRSEADALASVVHPNVVRLLGTMLDGDYVALVMPFAEGGSLEELLARRGRLTPVDAVALLAPVADALAAVHRAGIVHGDVKPANVLLDATGAPLLADFGAARATDVTGSAAYVDPHLLETGRPEPTNDVYSLGVIAFRALAGTLPHVGATDDDVVEAARARAHRPLATVADVPPPLAAVVEAALSLNPAERPSSAERFAEGLRASVAAGGTTRTFGPRPIRPEPVAPPAPRANVAVIGVVAAAVLVVAAIGAVAVGMRRHPSACPARVALDVPAGAHELRADLRGDGCEVPVTWDGRVMQVQLRGEDTPRRYDFRPPGAARRSGALLLGDWDCDGADSPAFYDPASGRIHYFALVPRTGALAPQDIASSGVEGGRASVARTAAGCDRVVIRPAA
jgi:hypothetical protein